MSNIWTKYDRTFPLVMLLLDQELHSLENILLSNLYHLLVIISPACMEMSLGCYLSGRNDVVEKDGYIITWLRACEFNILGIFWGYAWQLYAIINILPFLCHFCYVLEFDIGNGYSITGYETSRLVSYGCSRIKIWWLGFYS